MTELGITKGPSKNYTNDDIEKIVAACWKGEGTEERFCETGEKERRKRQRMRLRVRRHLLKQNGAN